jgi:chromosome segregation ATPase
MKYSPLIIALLSVILVSCNSKKIERLEAERVRLQADSLAKDSILNGLFTTFNDIENNLAEIAGRQQLIREVTANENPSQPDVMERIRLEISAINAILIDNEERLKKLIDQLKTSNLKIKALEETIAILNKRIEEKDIEIIQLRKELIALNIEIESLDKMVATLEEDKELQRKIIEEKEKSIDQHNQVWYVVGTKKYLKDNEIIENTGFLGSSKKLNDKLQTGLFTEADMRKLNSIEINSAKAALITIHPEGSYEFIKEGEVFISLKIVNPEEFWKGSKFCVLETR